MTRALYIKHLEHDIEASKKAINDLIQENYELREQLKLSQNNVRSHQKNKN